MKGSVFNIELAALRGSIWPRSCWELFEEDFKPFPDLPGSHLPSCIAHKGAQEAFVPAQKVSEAEKPPQQACAPEHTNLQVVKHIM